MAGSSLGNIFRITTWGESHGPGVGVVVDGCPAGLSLCEGDIQEYLNRRKPGQSRFSTPRKEEDQVEILSGLFEGRTTGTPIAMMVHNKTQRSQDYSEIASYYRPGHADYTYDKKYGFRDYRGGGRSSGRETIGRVAGGAVAIRMLKEIGVTFITYTKSIGPVAAETFDAEEIPRNPLYMPDAKAAELAQQYLNRCMREHDSSGGVIECIVEHLPTGLGDPVFDKLNASLARAVCSVGAVKGFEIGDGFAAAKARGSENNDSFRIDGNGQVCKASNHAGGVLGGISDGSPLIFRAAVKPTPSVFCPQNTVNTSGEEITCQIKGRHDPVIVPRAVVVIESMAALVIADALLSGMAATMDNVIKIWG